MHAGSPTESGKYNHHTSPLNSYCGGKPGKSHYHKLYHFVHSSDSKSLVVIQCVCVKSNVAWITVRSIVELGHSERYLGSMMWSLAVIVGLHLSLMVADLPCLQA